jgi:hypothetical protein
MMGNVVRFIDEVFEEHSGEVRANKDMEDVATMEGDVRAWNTARFASVAQLRENMAVLSSCCCICVGPEKEPRTRSRLRCGCEV